jgi:hypothetical protein
MPLSILLIMSIGLVVGAALQCLAPLNFRPGIFFGVTVDPEFCRTEDAQRILWSYRRPIIVMTVLCIATLWLVVPRLGGPAAPIAASALVFLGVSVAIVRWPERPDTCVHLQSRYLRSGRYPSYRGSGRCPEVGFRSSGQC